MEGNIVIEGLENFSFIDMPQEELELREHFNRFIEQMRQNEIQLQAKQKQQSTTEQGPPTPAQKKNSTHSQNVYTKNFDNSKRDINIHGK